MVDAQEDSKQLFCQRSGGMVPEEDTLFPNRSFTMSFQVDLAGCTMDSYSLVRNINLFYLVILKHDAEHPED